ncbi:amino acid adenylation domain-containing protein [Streptomyces sp. NPDC008163]|uniref:amino acid adenylation domain-containing protein n=1 Tax=Streptomyces sp. NPDC008163 TaxID=3364818 RepID=UPI0036E69478
MSSQNIADIYELSPLQQGLMFHTLAGTDPEMYVAQRSFRLQGRLDAQALSESWQDVVERHPALRTTFHWADLDKPLQVVHRAVPVELTVLDWRELEPKAQGAAMDRALREDRSAGFDLTAAPLMRLTLVRLGEETYRFVWTHHMMLLDGWSVPLVTRDLFLAYAARTRGERAASPSVAPFGAYIGWLQSRDPADTEQFWRDTLHGCPDAAPLARAGTGPVAPGTPAETGVEELRLSARTTAALRALASRHQVTLNTVVQATWALLVARHTDRDDVVIGMTTAGRPAALPGVESMVGLFINTLPLRLRVPEELSLGPWLREVQERQTAVREHEHSPLSLVQRWSGLPAGQPLFESIVVFENYPVPTEVRQWIGDLRITTDTSFEKTSEALTVVASTEPDLTVRLQYHRNRFDEGVVAAYAEQLRTLFEHLAVHPDGLVGDIELLTDSAYRALAEHWSGPRLDYPADATLHGLVERQAARTPDAVAVRSRAEQLTYAQLDEEAERVAAGLRARGIGPGSVVAVCADRSSALVTALLGVLKTGAAYLPLDPGLPDERLRFMLTDAAARLVLTDRAVGLPPHLTALPIAGPWAAPVERAGPAVGPQTAAYVIYTSGSTGRPKGVAVSHAAIVNRILWMRDTFALTSEDRVLQKTPYSFDVSVWEFFLPLVSGAELVLARPGGHRDAAYLVEAVAEFGITVLHFVPSMLTHFLEEPGCAGSTSVRLLFCSGEALPYDVATRAMALLPGAGVHNLYGPTEAAVDVTWWDCRDSAPAGTVPIGRPVANTQIHLLDRRFRPVPVGVPGELYIGGAQVALEYVGRGALTAASFLPDPYAPPGGRLYRTGDLARRLPDGSVEFLGRLDHQVKLRGFRIEPGEIEHRLREHPAVRDAAVVLREDRPGRQRLTGYAVPHGAAPTPAELRAHLGARLPAHMVPADLLLLDALPMTAHGKLDRASLPAPRLAHADVPAQDVEPLSGKEIDIARVFAQVLGLDQGAVGPEADFFALGGDSLSALRAVRDLPGTTVTTLFQWPSPRGLAAALRDHGAQKPRAVLLDLTSNRRDADRTLLCVPYGGGTPLSYLPLAQQLPDRIAVRAVTLPGHDAGSVEELQTLETVAEACLQEVLVQIPGRIAIYGHCIGVALAVELAHRLERAGRTVDRVFLGGSFPFPSRQVLGMDLTRILPFRRRETDERILRYLQSLGGFEELVDEDELAHVMRAFRHDGNHAREYFNRHRASGGPAPLAAPITFVAGTEDPETRGFERRHREWESFSPVTDLAVIPGGGHYFLKHHATELAELVQHGW